MTNGKLISILQNLPVDAVVAAEIIQRLDTTTMGGERPAYLDVTFSGIVRQGEIIGDTIYLRHEVTL